MFKIPEWDGDTSKDTITVNFKKNNKKKSLKDKVNPTKHNNTNITRPISTDILKQKIKYNKKKKIKIIDTNKNKVNGDITFKPPPSNNTNPGKYGISPYANKDNANILRNNKSVSRNHKENLNSQNSIKANKRVKNNVNGLLSRKHNIEHSTNETETAPETNINVQSCNTDNLDEMFLKAKKKKIDAIVKSEDDENLLFCNSVDNENHDENKSEIKDLNMEACPVSEDANSDKKVKTLNNSKKRIMKQLLTKYNNRSIVNVYKNKLRERMLEKLKAAQFRYLNEKLYTSSGIEAQELFQANPAAFQVYHKGYQQQVKKWPVKPLDVIIKVIMKMPKSHVIADMGCGEAILAQRVSNKVHSFDLVASGPGVVACDMSRTPLAATSVDVVVFCLALMGTELSKYLVEANRILKSGGQLLIAEVVSRFDNIDNFIKDLERLGFKLKKLNKNNDVFYFMEFTKFRDPPVKKSKLPALTLKPCLYKKR